MKAAATRHASCERDFVYKSIKQGIRLDGRQSHDYRDISVTFGKEYGHCEVSLGDTRCLAQVSCEIVKPRESRPSDGQLNINVDLSPMASPAFENGRISDYGIEINRILERCLKESKAVDVESLCLVAGEKVWAIRVDVFVLNDGGNLVDCACIAAISALANFRRPDVTVSSKDITIHSADEKEYIPLNVHHIPVCTTYGFVDNGEQVIIDPEEKEEGVTTGRFTIATNIHHEICCAHVSGELTLDAEQILQCAKISLIKSSDITDIIKAALQEDEAKRAPPKVVKKRLKDPVNITTPISRTIAEATQDDLTEKARALTVDTSSTSTTKNEKQPIENLGRATAVIGDGKSIAWSHSDSDVDDDETSPASKIDSIKTNDVDMDSEEESVQTLRPDDLDQVGYPEKRSELEDSNSPVTENNASNGNLVNEKNNSKKKKKKKRKLIQNNKN